MLNYYCPPEGNVFIHVCLSFCPQGVPCDHYPWCIGTHWTGPPWTLDLRDPQIPLAPPDMGPQKLPASDICWWSLKTCSNFKIHPSAGADIWWLWSRYGQLLYTGKWRRIRMLHRSQTSYFSHSTKHAREVIHLDFDPRKNATNREISEIRQKGLNVLRKCFEKVYNVHFHVNIANL